LTIETLGEHKNRVLSAADDWQAVETARSHSSEKTDAHVRWKEPVSRDADEAVAEGNGSALSGQDGVIKEVISTERGADGFGDPGDSKEDEEQGGQGMKEKELQDPSDSEVEHRDGSGAAAGSTIAGMRTAGNLTSSLEQVKFIKKASLLLGKDDRYIATYKRFFLLKTVNHIYRPGVSGSSYSIVGCQTNLGMNLVPLHLYYYSVNSLILRR
jgi:hypothetical protein